MRKSFCLNGVTCKLKCRSTSNQKVRKAVNCASVWWFCEQTDWLSCSRRLNRTCGNFDKCVLSSFIYFKAYITQPRGFIPSQERLVCYTIRGQSSNCTLILKSTIHFVLFPPNISLSHIFFCTSKNKDCQIESRIFWGQLRVRKKTSRANEYLTSYSTVSQSRLVCEGSSIRCRWYELKQRQGSIREKNCREREKKYLNSLKKLNSLWLFLIYNYCILENYCIFKNIKIKIQPCFFFFTFSKHCKRQKSSSIN